MNLITKSSQPVDFRVFFYFHDDTCYEFRARMSGRSESLRHTIVGRTPDDVEKVLVKYDGVLCNYPLMFDARGDLTVELHGERDMWSEMLRKAALAAPESS